MKRIAAFALMLMLGAMIAPARAQNEEEGLYDPSPPADSAFVRFIHADAASAVLSATVGGAVFPNIAYPGVAPYVILKAGEYAFETGAAKEQARVEAGKYYTFAVMRAGGKPVVKTFEDALIANPAKSVVYFYNLSDQKQASLVAPAHKADIVPAVASGAAGSREVNALTLDLAIAANGTVAEGFKNVTLRRRAGFTFVLAGETGALKGVFTENELKR